MGNNEKEQLLIEVKSANMPLVRWVIGGSAGVIATVLWATMYLSNVLYDISTLKQWKAETQPKIEIMNTQIAILNSKNQ